MSTSRRGQMIPRGDRKWLLRVYIGRNAIGKRQYQSKMFEGSTSQASQALTKMLREDDTGTLVRPGKMTLLAYLQQWYATKVQISRSTLAGYKAHMKLYIIPTLGHLNLQEITPAVVQSTYNGLSEREMSPRVIEYSHTVLHQALAKAVKLGFLMRNPTEETERPAKTRREFTILSPQQMVTLLTSEKNRPLCTLWVLLLNTGLRPGEALALRWSDLEGDTLHVQRVLAKCPQGGFEVIEQKAKTDASMRAITLPISVLEALRKHRAASGQLHGYMFQNIRGNPMNPGSVRNAWKVALQRAKLSPNVRLYDTRHSHATALLNEGNVNLAWVSARLGHTSIRTTEAVYTRVMPEAHRSMADTMETILKKAANHGAS